MLVAFDARMLGDPRLRDSGIGRYARCLLEALPGAGVEPAVIRSLRRPPAPARLTDAWDHLLLGPRVRRTGASVLHAPSLEGLSLRPGAPLVVTLHDLVPLKRPERYLRTGLKHRLRWAAVRRASRVIVPSGSVAEDGERLHGR